MAESLLDTKLKEAVERGRGDKQAAVRLLIAWSEHDEVLFRALVQPFLQGILFHLVDRTVKHMTGDPVAPRAASAEAKPAKPADQELAKLTDKLAVKLSDKPAAAQPTENPTPAKAAAKLPDKPAALVPANKPAPIKLPPAMVGKPDELPPALIDALVAHWGAKIPVATKPALDHPPRTVEEALEGLGQAGPPPPGKASGRHQSGMRLIAKVQRMKRSTIG
jgi:hypothetical protein